MIAPLFGTKSALDHPTDRPAILRIFLSDRYPLFPQTSSRIRFVFATSPGPGTRTASSPLRPASAERFRRRPRTSARATHARLRQTLPVFRPKYTPIIRNDTNVPSFPPKFRLLPYRSCDGTGRSERPCGAIAPSPFSACRRRDGNSGYGHRFRTVSAGRFSRAGSGKSEFHVSNDNENDADENQNRRDQVVISELDLMPVQTERRSRYRLKISIQSRMDGRELFRP